jgi:hypothetical protein
VPDFHWTGHVARHSAAIGYVVAIRSPSAARMKRVVGVGIDAVVDLCVDVATNPTRLRREALSRKR